MMLLFHGLCYSVEFSVVALTFILSFDFLFHLLQGKILPSACCHKVIVSLDPGFLLVVAKQRCNVTVKRSCYQQNRESAAQPRKSERRCDAELPCFDSLQFTFQLTALKRERQLRTTLRIRFTTQETEATHKVVIIAMKS